ncbi:MAG: A/G-specific adenine glycosylase, partial [Phycisphaeraceae bacterium]|nr:A/G-specific adenine glycosylase [Phycisphaeraceae bacterium]
MTKTPDLPTSRLRRQLLRWYRQHHRRMPWRARPGRLADPYACLISETMLQQTQVATVIDYFKRFMTQFPTVSALAAADEQEVLTAWQGLGYYRRARHLHAAATMVVEQFDGRIPDTREKLLDLPGVGPYTAGAVASMAFGESTPAVDGNVKRVISRLAAIDNPVDQPDVKRRLTAISDDLVPDEHPGDFNQALMELGATLCTPTRPDCPQCPLNDLCRAHEEGIEAELPIKSRRVKRSAARHEVIAIRRHNQWLFVQRPERGLWSAMWQMPTRETAGPNPEEAPDAPDTPLADWVRDQTGLVVNSPRPLEAFEHATTHRQVHFHPHVAEATGGR